MDKKIAIVIVDYQYDFADPKGGLYVNEGEKLKDQIQGFLNNVKDKATIVASKDWHPVNHSSFKEFGGQWNPHCIANTKGAELYFDSSFVDLIINKGTHVDKEEYSCIKNDDIKEFFNHFTDVFVLGLAKDFCVKNTLLGITAENVYLVDDLSKSVFPNKDTELTLSLKENNIKIINKKEAEEIICK